METLKALVKNSKGVIKKGLIVGAGVIVLSVIAGAIKNAMNGETVDDDDYEADLAELERLEQEEVDHD